MYLHNENAKKMTKFLLLQNAIKGPYISLTLGCQCWRTKIFKPTGLEIPPIGDLGVCENVQECYGTPLLFIK